MNFLQEHYKMLNEQYYGKNPILIKIDKEFDEIIKIIREKQTDIDYAQLVPMGSKEMKRINVHKVKIEKYVEELFNFKEVNIQIVNMGVVNAFTVSKEIIPTIIWAEKENGKYGIRYKNKTRTLLGIITVEIMSFKGVNGSIMTAILLHEIGHNFYYENNIIFYLAQLDIYYKLYRNITATVNIESNKSMSKMKMEEYNKKRDELLGGSKDKKSRGIIFKTLTPMLLSLPLGKFIVSKIVKFGENTIIRSNMQSLLNTLLIAFNSINCITQIGQNAGNTIKMLFNPIKLYGIQASYFLTNPLSIASTITQKRNELFADNFATAFGYGPELTQMTIINNRMTGYTLADILSKKSKTISILIDALSNILDLFPDPFSDRVFNATRLLDQLNYLESNLKNECLDNKQKKAIEKDLNEVKQKCKEMKDMSSLDGDLVKNGKIFTAFILQRDLATKGELSYHLNYKTYDNDGNWKNLV